MVREITMRSKLYLFDADISDKPTKEQLDKSKKLDIKAFESDEGEVIIKEIDNKGKTAVIQVGEDEFKVPKKSFKKFKALVGNGKVIDKSVRFRTRKKYGVKKEIVTNIWEKREQPTDDDVELIGDEIAMILSGTNPVVDLRGKGTHNKPHLFVKKRERVRADIAFARGFNVSERNFNMADSDGLRLKYDSQDVVGEVMYVCEDAIKVDDFNDFQLCRGIKIRNVNGVFVAEDITRAILRENIGRAIMSSESGGEMTAIVDKTVNNTILDMVNEKKQIVSNNPLLEASEIVEAFDLDNN